MKRSKSRPPTKGRGKLRKKTNVTKKERGKRRKNNVVKVKQRKRPRKETPAPVKKAGSNTPKTHLFIREPGKRLTIAFEQIIYIESDKANKVAVHVAGSKEVYRTRRTLKELVDTAGKAYLRIHHCIIANMAFMKGMLSETNFQAA